MTTEQNEAAPKLEQLALGTLTGRVLRILGHTEPDPMDAAVGYDAGPQRWDAIFHRIHLLLAQNGYTPETFLAEVESRTGYKFVYQTGLVHIDNGCCTGREMRS